MLPLSSHVFLLEQLGFPLC